MAKLLTAATLNSVLSPSIYKLRFLHCSDEPCAMFSQSVSIAQVWGIADFPVLFSVVFYEVRVWMEVTRSQTKLILSECEPSRILCLRKLKSFRSIISRDFTKIKNNNGKYNLCAILVYFVKDVPYQ